jgi:hypothetical protein
MNERMFEKLLMLYGNDTCVLSEQCQNLYKELLINLFQSKYNIRYCTNNNCKCQPETRINLLLDNNELKTFLNKRVLYEDIKNYINNRDMSITVFGRGFE